VHLIRRYPWKMLVYICLSYLYEMWLSQEVLEMSSLSVNTQLNTTLHVSEGGCHHLDLMRDQVCVVCLCRHVLLDDPTGKSQVGSNLVTLEAIVLVKLLCLGKMI
jgi:hypothetical protein